jgi:long-chain acyl-CoA synthetase
MAGESLRQGYNLLIFPEGTRSKNGELLEFKPTLGFLALTYGMDVLPLYIDGAYAALPKGAILPRQRELAVRIGPVLEVEALRKRTRGMSRSESYRFSTRMAEESVRALKDGGVFTLEDSSDATAEQTEQPGRALRRLPSGGEA